MMKSKMTMERDRDSLSSISLLAEFDDLVRNERVLNDGSEKEFLKYVKNSETCRRRWEQSELECQRLSIELTKAAHEITGLETKLQQARMLFDDESHARKRAETERDRLAAQLHTLRQLILDTDGMDEGTLRKVKNFESFNDHQDIGYGNVLSPGLMREAGMMYNDRRSTIDGSVLDVDDLSFDETVNLCESRTRAGTQFKKLTPEVREARKRSRSNQRRSSGIMITDPQPLESDRARKRERRSRSVGISDKVEILEITPREPKRRSADDDESLLAYSAPAVPLPSASSTSSNSFHDMEEKTELKSNKCYTCNKRIKFGKIYHKCRQCKIVVHMECQAPSMCAPVSPTKVSTIPSVYLTRTPSKKENKQIFASPMLQ